MTVHGQHAAPRFRRFRVWPRPAAPTAGPAAETPAQDVPDEGAACDASYGNPGWDDSAPEVQDDTMVWRVPRSDGGPGLVLPPGAPWAQGREDQEDREDREDRKPLPHRTPGALIPPALVPVLRTEPADPAILRKAIDALKALPCDPEPEEDEEREEPAAYLRAVVPDGETGVTQIQDALGHSPLFAGHGVLADGRLVAGMYLGTNDDGWFVLDALSAEWCEDAITALTAMRDALVAAQDGDADGEAAA